MTHENTDQPGWTIKFAIIAPGDTELPYPHERFVIHKEVMNHADAELGVWFWHYDQEAV